MPEFDLITKRSTLMEAYPNFGKRFPSLDLSHYGIKADEAEFIQKGITSSDLKFEEGERAVVSTITTASKDRDREIVDPAGAILKEYEKNKVVLFGHNHHSLPIGKNIWIKLSTDKKSLIAKTEYTPEEANPLGNQIFEYRKAGFPLAQSIGFIPIEWTSFNDGDGTPESKAGVRKKYTKWILLEYSDVPVPSNPEAVALAVSKSLLPVEDVEPYGVKQEEVLTLLEPEEIMKGAIPFHDYGIVENLNAEWDAAAEIKAADVEDLKRMSTWFDGDGESKGLYKLPHHKASGENPAVWRGVYASMAAILGARGGVQIPEIDRKKSYNHIKEHYSQFEKDVPKFKELFEIDFESEEKAGRTLSTRTRKSIIKATEAMVEAVGALGTLMAEADKPRKTDAENTLEPDEDKKEFLTIAEPLEDMISVDEKEINERISKKVKDLLKQETGNIVRTTIDKMRGKV